MTTLAINAPRPVQLGEFEQYPVVASDIIYEGAAVGLVKASGHARPLVAGDQFAGFCTEPCDNSAGAAAAKSVLVRTVGAIQLTVTGVTATDIGQPVYASDDNAFSLSPVGGTFIGFVRRLASSGVAIVAYDAVNGRDPYAAYGVREAVAGALTLDAEDCGKLFWVTADAGVITLPAIADGLAGCLIVNGGSYGTVLVTVSPAAADMILAPNLAGVDNKDLLNTKATAQRGDRVRLINGDTDGYLAIELVGVWAKE
jgi:hypothetical protein